jgi:Zn-dependent oligopeptidases
MVKRMIPMQITKDNIRDSYLIETHEEKNNLTKEEVDLIIDRRYDLANGITLKTISPYSLYNEKKSSENYLKLLESYVDAQYSYYILSFLSSSEKPISKEEFNKIIIKDLDSFTEKAFEENYNLSDYKEYMPNIEQKKNLTPEQINRQTLEIMASIIREQRENRIKAGYGHMNHRKKAERKVG